MTHFRPLLRVGGRLLQPAGFFQRLFWGWNVTDPQTRNRLSPQANSIRLLAEQLVSVYGSADVRRLNYELPRRSLNRQRQRDRDLRKSVTSADFFATVNDQPGAAPREERRVPLLAGHRSIETTQGYIDGDTDAQRRLVSLI